MKTGTDISLAVCRCEGYMVVEHPARFKKAPLDKDYKCKLTVSNPDAWTDSGKVDFNTPDEPIYFLDEQYSFNDLLEILEEDGVRESVESSCDWENCQPNLDNPTIHDMLYLASDIQFCRSLQTS